jgi:hypothetical protein
MSVVPAGDFIARDPARQDAVPVALQANKALPSPKARWGPKIVSGLLIAGVFATILWAAFLCALVWLFVRSFF